MSSDRSDAARCPRCDDLNEDSAGAELSRLEDDMLEIHDELCDALSVDLTAIAINAPGIVDGIKKLAEQALDVEAAALSLAREYGHENEMPNGEGTPQAPGSTPYDADYWRDMASRTLQAASSRERA